jgi:DICT domain-containing protein
MHSEATLSQLKARLPGTQLPASYGVYFKNTLVALCHALEDHVLQQADAADLKPLVLTTFQRGKWYLQEADRYGEMAAVSGEIAIAATPEGGFAEHPTSQQANVHLIELAPDDSLTEEWNLVILAPGYAAMVLCHELSEADYHADTVPTTDVERKFYGLWTFDRALVEATAEILLSRFRPYAPELVDTLAHHHHQIQANTSSQPSDLSGVVTRIVGYLQSSQQQIVTVNRQSRELWELEGQALRLSRNLTANKLQAFLRMAQKVDERDPFNPVASLQVSALAETLGQLLDLPTLQLRRLRLAGLLFRIGLAEAPIEVFTQTADHLDETCRIFWRDRSLLGAQLLAAMPELEPIRQIVAHQLERWDGSGTPAGLQGEAIPLEARILGLIAYFQELTESRGERPALSLNEALGQCQARSGMRFDPKLVEALSTVVSLSEIGMMQLPDRPSQTPTVWLEAERTL